MSILCVKDFTKRYSKTLAVNSISFEVKKGEIVGFVGKNGAGKSTTIRAITNMIFPTGGEITVNGLDAQADAKKIKEFLSYMPSDSEFYDGVKVKDLFKFAAGFSQNGIEKANELSLYFELDTERKVRELSLGNKKKVSIICALIKKSDIIILDEPTSGLDPLMQEKFFEIILKRRDEGATVFLSSHNLSEIEKYCDRVIIIKDGKIVKTLDMKSVAKELGQHVYCLTKDGKEADFDYNGDINELIAQLASLDIEKLEIRPKTIEEEFIQYYKDGAENE